MLPLPVGATIPALGAAARPADVPMLPRNVLVQTEVVPGAINQEEQDALAEERQSQFEKYGIPPDVGKDKTAFTKRSYPPPRLSKRITLPSQALNIANIIKTNNVVQLLEPEDNKIIYLWGNNALTPFITQNGYGYAGFDCTNTPFDIGNVLLMISSSNTLGVTNGCITIESLEQYQQGPSQGICLNGMLPLTIALPLCSFVFDSDDSDVTTGLAQLANLTMTVDISTDLTTDDTDDEDTLAA